MNPTAQGIALILAAALAGILIGRTAARLHRAPSTTVDTQTNAVPRDELKRRIAELVDELGKVVDEREELRGQRDEARALAATCECQSWPPDGPSADCPVHGAIRAFNEAVAEINAMRPVVEAAEAYVEARFTPRSRLALGLANAVDVWRAAQPDQIQVPADARWQG